LEGGRKRRSASFKLMGKIRHIGVPEGEEGKKGREGKL